MIRMVFTLFWYREDGPDPADSWMRITNNIISLPNGGKVFYDGYQWPHDHNVINGPLNDDLGDGDIQAEPDLDDGYTLSPDSPARGNVAAHTASTDFYGTPTGDGPTSDIGAVVADDHAGGLSA
ncbi:hypothetical protein [Streptomyces sp. NPDC006012]|uniref:hypothetical protein n=1 Tax=Streptomyces sp. NPDC006012 TaxID=3364739 RepID=UPI003673F3CA